MTRFLSIIFTSVVSLSQMTMTAQPRAVDGMAKMIDEINGKPPWQKLESIEGTAFLSDEWNEGFVRFADGAIVKKVLLKFNVQANELYFMRSGQAFAFDTPPSDFSFSYRDGGDTKVVFYRSGYPPYEKNRGTTYYEVVADGKVQLLKHSTRLMQKATPAAYSSDAQNKYVTRDHYYVYNDGKLVPVVLSKKSLLEALGNYRGRAEEWAKTNGDKLRSEDAAVLLVNYLNAPHAVD